MGLLSRKINFIIVLDLVMVVLSHAKYMWNNIYGFLYVAMWTQYCVTY
jgi:hypothetical protein